MQWRRRNEWDGMGECGLVFYNNIICPLHRPLSNVSWRKSRRQFRPPYSPSILSVIGSQYLYLLLILLRSEQFHFHFHFLFGISAFTLHLHSEYQGPFSSLWTPAVEVVDHIRSALCIYKALGDLEDVILWLRSNNSKRKGTSGKSPGLWGCP